MKWRRRKALALLLAFSMVMSLFTGQIVGKTEASAAEDSSDEIVLGTLQKSADGTYYTYPNAKVDIAENTKLYNLTVMVDSGHMKLPDETVNTTIAGTTGQGIEAGTGMDSTYEELSTSKKYEAIMFEFADGVSKTDVEKYIRTIQFTTANTTQTVEMWASTQATGNLKTTIDGQEIELKYFNGHYYGFIPSYQIKWSEAYKQSKTATFNGVSGYLLTITSRAEDRFILSSFPESAGSNKAKSGWMGCTRAVLAAGSSYTDADTTWKKLAKFDGTNYDEFQWRWVSGPETGQEFGYQNDAFGYFDAGNFDGGFVTNTSAFSNWGNSSSNVEPNGGSYSDEAFGYYGKYEYGRWNDNADSPTDNVAGYYIEFGGNTGDTEKFESALTQIIATGSETSDEIITDGTYEEDKVADLNGTPAIVPSKRDGSAGTVLTADISGIGPKEALTGLKYQWYTVENGVETPIDGANNATYTTTENDKDKTFVVKVIGSDSYPGTLTSEKLIPIQDEVKVVNKSNDVVKTGTILSADITGVNPTASHDTLTYQWYTVKNGVETPIDGAVYKNYTLTSGDIGKDIIVKVTGNGNYYNTLSSEPYDATRTDSDITLKDPTTDSDTDTMTITIDPTMDGYVYTLQYPDGTLVDPTTAMKVVDADGNEITPDEDGYFSQDAGGTIKFTELDKDKTYVIVKKTAGSDDAGDTNGVVGPSISDVKTEYNDTADTISIIVDPALEDTVYAIRKKVDGVYVDIPVSKDSDGNYVQDDTNGSVWTNGEETIVTFASLPADGTYKVVAKSSNGQIKDITPGDIIGGSKDIVGEDSKTEGSKNESDATDESSPSATAAPSVSTQTTTVTTPTSTSAPAADSQYTPQQQETAKTFVKDFITGPNGKVITSITDATRDIIVSGESSWNKLTAAEKALINQQLKEAGSKYTYEQLLKMAKKYKIPGFKVIKFMQKKTKATLKLIKCKGATIVCTSTNKKVATVNKKGVITAKKPGRTTLTITAIKGKYTNRLVIDLRVYKKFKNAKELTKFKSNVIKTPTILISKKRLLKKSSRIDVYDLEKNSKVKFTPIKKNILKINKKGKYTGKKKGSTLVRVNINQNKKVYVLYVYVTIY